MGSWFNFQNLALTLIFALIIFSWASFLSVVFAFFFG
jgi:hypothetical protein